MPDTISKENNMTEAVMFDSNGNNILPARILYKKNILALRGSLDHGS